MHPQALVASTAVGVFQGQRSNQCQGCCKSGRGQSRFRYLVDRLDFFQANGPGQNKATASSRPGSRGRSRASKAVMVAAVSAGQQARAVFAAPGRSGDQWC